MTVTLSPSQKAVVDHFPIFLMGEDTEMTIAGFAGSGKTFLVQYMASIQERMQKFISALDQQVPKRRIYYTATTNKAAHVLERSLGEETRTIHSLLGLRVYNNYTTGKQELRPSGKAENLEHSIIFIDEASMINRDLLSTIRKAVDAARDCKVVFIGDQYQLPPVMEDVCPVFSDGPNTVRLEEIQRQVAGNPIIQLSGQYRACLDDHNLPWPEIVPDNKHIFVYDNKDSFFQVIEDAYLQDHDKNDLRILAWSNQRVQEYNRWIRHLEGRPIHFEPGERVLTNKPLIDTGGSRKMILAQTDSILTVDKIQFDRRHGIDGWDIRLKETGMWFFQPRDWREANQLCKQYAADAKQTGKWDAYWDIKENWSDLRPIHASTVHKAQGSTYRDVFVDLNNIGKNNHWREVARLVYVAITRASHSVHVFGTLQERYERKPLVDLMEPFKNVDCLAR